MFFKHSFMFFPFFFRPPCFFSIYKFVEGNVCATAHKKGPAAFDICGKAFWKFLFHILFFSIPIGL